MALISYEMRRFAAALRAGEVVGDVADEIERFADCVDAERATHRNAQRDALAKVALDEQRAGRDAAACVYMAALHMVS